MRQRPRRRNHSTDVLTAERFHEHAHATLRDAGRVRQQKMILAIGPESARNLVAIVREAGTVIWNGPLGTFEFETFYSGTQTIAQAVAECEGFTLAGGGDTIGVVEKLHVADWVD